MIMQGKTTVNSVAKTIVTYVVWIIFSISQVFLALSIHELIVSAAILFSTNAWAPRAIDMWSMVILGIAVLATIFLTEAFLAKGMRLGLFWQRVGIIALIEGILAAVIYGIGLIL
jgi:hypothetical protein